jgi:hypothetical protein
MDERHDNLPKLGSGFSFRIQGQRLGVVLLADGYDQGDFIGGQTEILARDQIGPAKSLALVDLH